GVTEEIVSASPVRLDPGFDAAGARPLAGQDPPSRAAGTPEALRLPGEPVADAFFIDGQPAVVGNQVAVAGKAVCGMPDELLRRCAPGCVRRKRGLGLHPPGQRRGLGRVAAVRQLLASQTAVLRGFGLLLLVVADAAWRQL